MRTFSAFLVALLAAGAAAGADPASWKSQTYAYKTIDGLPVQLDVHRSADSVARPVVVWIHGGALISGSRSAVPKDLLELCRKQGYALVSIDYRLAPEVKAPAIIEDVKDAFAWIEADGRKLAHLDPSRLVVTGGSAGGYLTLMVGVVVRPRPRALVAYWGYGDLDGAWYMQPSEYYRTAGPLISREEALKGLDGKPVTGARDAAHAKARGTYYRYLRQNGLWTREVTGFDPQKQRDKIDPLCPVRNLTPDYPPVLLIHGEEDEDVPFQESVDMDRALTEHKVPHEFIRVPRGRHGLAGADRQLVTATHARALQFVKQHLEK
jgi:acetyl esterase/lipase